MEMNKKKILITGTNRGLGKFLLEKLSLHYTVYGTSRNGSSSLFLDLDAPLTLSKSVKNILRKVSPDILIHNAGIGASGVYADFSGAQIKKLFQTNLFGPLKFIKLLLGLHPQLKMIILISTQAAVKDYSSLGMYAASKIALEKSLGDYLRFSTIKMVIIRPGPLLLPGKNYLPTILKGKSALPFLPHIFFPPEHVVEEIKEVINRSVA